MRLFAALATALALIGSAGIAVAACAGHAKQEQAQEKLLPDGTTS